ncbi:hypothetical protein CXG81DRAFT_13234 [Caulochytrium protostelioides]|uniref:Ribosomal protein L22 n=1 Tax=Caulochytrium protostelioides TaxID=1555241 RepID=A0A4P9X5M2_9FUNG|nr:ribosomal protein L22 [Caulochytrium protostelioides]RKP00434.1 hypothetical protein CXG81DRAFT_13234 [Caulochytrium protostelioides]|eukprot:RKP00434.1 hypothetical protein CXG81DRAFT_13234 [Caulochytrium protostelioides]
MNVLRDPEVVPPTKRRFPRRDFFSTGNFKGSPRKAMLLARLLPGMTLKEALLQMDLSLKKPGSPIRALVHRVACNLRHNYAIRDPLDNVKITEAWVGKGHYKKQIKIHGRGRFGIMYKKEAHVRIRVAPALAQSRRATLRHFAAWLKEAKTQKLNPNTMPNSRKVAYTLPPWSRRPWKYVERPHWYDPERAYPAAR